MRQICVAKLRNAPLKFKPNLIKFAPMRFETFWGVRGRASTAGLNFTQLGFETIHPKRRVDRQLRINLPRRSLKQRICKLKAALADG